MTQLPDLFSNNRKWSEGIKRREPGFFDRLARQQAPRYLWIGCSDSRVPANEIVGLVPGELFVHRNVIDNWLRHVQDVADRHRHLFTRGMSATQCTDRLAQLNVIEQVANVCRSTIVMDAWRRGQSLAVHGWIYSLQDGLLRDLGLSVTRDDGLAGQYESALAGLVPGVAT